ncbi:MAG: guanylate kinase [Muricoprocola sp.]
MLFYLIGKSASGKDTIYHMLYQDTSLGLHALVMYTTRPARDTETQGKEYFFVDDAYASEMEARGKVIEMRAYHTVHGIWKYFTVDDENLDVENKNYLGIGTLESYQKIRDYFGADLVIPIYIEVDDGIRLERALIREKMPQNQKYEEMCRRFLADAADYSEDKIKEAGIEKRFYNNESSETCFKEISAYIAACVEQHTITDDVKKEGK